jgi:hypothetical protein
LRPTLASDEAEAIRSAYQRALERSSRHISEILDAVDEDARVVVCGDHGEEFGEDGYWFHGGFRRRVVDTLTHVPVRTRNLPLGTDTLGLATLPNRLASSVGIHPFRWLSPGPGQMTVAPWAGKATVRWHMANQSLTVRDGDFEEENFIRVSHDVSSQLEALGYRGTG